MQRLIPSACVILLSLGSQSAPPWVLLTRGYPAVSVDTSSVVRVDATTQLATFRVRYAGDARMPGAPVVPPHREMRMLAEVRCADSTFRPLSMQFYDSAGRPLARTREAGPWMRHEPPMVGYLLTAGFCAQVSSR